MSEENEVTLTNEDVALAMEMMLEFKRWALLDNPDIALHVARSSVRVPDEGGVTFDEKPTWRLNGVDGTGFSMLSGSGEGETLKEAWDNLLRNWQ